MFNSIELGITKCLTVRSGYAYMLIHSAAMKRDRLENSGNCNTVHTEAAQVCIRAVLTSVIVIYVGGEELEKEMEGMVRLVVVCS